MKILLDENIDVRFKNYFKDTVHDVFTIRDMKWNGFQNGVLINLIKENNFDCWIVVDKNIPYQQNLTDLSCIIIVLDVLRNTLVNIIPLLPEILTSLENISENKVAIVPQTNSVD